jgi:hypothetical protein
MAGKLMLAALLLISLTGFFGCATPTGVFNADQPGLIPFEGGEIQLFFSNPDYGDRTDKLVRDQYEMMEIFGKKSGNPVVTGGVGAMAVWHF